MERVIENRDLEVPLTAEERLGLAEELTNAAVGLDMLENKKADAAKEYGDQIKGVRATISRVGAQLKRGTKIEEVACEWSFDFDSGVKTLTRADTGEVVTEAPVTTTDRQMVLGDLPGNVRVFPAVASAEQ